MEDTMALRVPKAELDTSLTDGMIDQFGAVPEPVEVTWHNPKVAAAAIEFGGNVALGVESQGFSAACEIPLAARPGKVAA
jgi:hypothetical protein